MGTVASLALEQDVESPGDDELRSVSSRCLNFEEERYERRVKGRI